MLKTDRELLYNPFDPALRVDPYPIYRRLRETDPVHRSPLGFWVLSRYADVVEVQRAPDLSFFSPRTMERLRVALEDPSNPAMKVGRWLSFLDRSEHKRFRGLLGRFFTPTALEATRPLIVRSVEQLLDRFPDDRPVDLIGEFAQLLPINMLCEWLGLPREDHERCRGWAASIGRILTSVLNPEMIRRMSGAVLACDAYLRVQLAERRANPRDDLLSALLDAKHGGRPITEDELVGDVTLLLGATYETSVNLIGNGILALLSNPDQLALLREDPSLIANAVEELLRYDAPAQLHGRWAAEDLPVGGKVIPAGARLVILIGSANRDPERFPDPDRLDLRRSDAQSASFGNGVHYCLGAWVARMETQIAISMLLDRFPRIGPLTTPPQWRSDPPAIRGLKELPVRVSTR